MDKGKVARFSAQWVIKGERVIVPVVVKLKTGVIAQTPSLPLQQLVEALAPQPRWSSIFPQY